MSEVSACWSPLWKVRSDVANNRAMARLSWTRLPAAEARVVISTGGRDRVWLKKGGDQEWPAIRTLETGPDVTCQESRGRGEAGQEAVHDELP